MVGSTNNNWAGIRLYLNIIKTWNAQTNLKGIFHRESWLFQVWRNWPHVDATNFIRAEYPLEGLFFPSRLPMRLGLRMATRQQRSIACLVVFNNPHDSIKSVFFGIAKA
ncbi:MAG: hypothetical protein ABSA01_15920 [Anaerolineales bacterium]|jgi:hypothetical protein